MNIIPFKALLPQIERISDQDGFFDSVKENFKQFYDKGYYTPRATAFYICCIKSPKKQSIGLIGTTHVKDYLSGKILKHEKTIHQKEQIQVELLQKRAAVVKPVLLVHQRALSISNWLLNYSLTHRAILEFKFPDQEEHLLWEIQQESDILEIQGLLKTQLHSVAIADGHHRFSSFAFLSKAHANEAYNPYEAVLSAYFPENELSIETFHRLVELPRSFDEQLFLRQLGELGSLNYLTSPEFPAHKHQMSIVLAGKWYRFDWRSSLLEQESAQMLVLDVNLLYAHILSPLLHIKNVQSDTKLHYLEGTAKPEQIKEALDQMVPSICFVLYPINSGDFLKLARLKMILVPKATFFLPRLKNGLVVQALNRI
jgi:uncharacterized protein (DUF1015 family)